MNIVWSEVFKSMVKLNKIEKISLCLIVWINIYKVYKIRFLKDNI